MLEIENSKQTKEPPFLLPNREEIKKKILEGCKKLRVYSKKRNGFFLIALMGFILIITTLALIQPILVTGLNLKDQSIRAARDRAEDLALTTTSPIRTRLVDEIYNRVQGQLVEHIQKNKGSSSYSCQGVEYQPTTIDPNSKLDNQPGLCQPELILNGINGLSNQSINFLDTIYPDWKTPLIGENEVARQQIIRQHQNNYSYILTNTYVSGRPLDDTNTKSFKNATGFTRTEYYHWQVRADIEATLPPWFNMTWGMVANYDVNLTINYYPSNFAGGGSLCDRRDSNMGARECPPEYEINGVCMPAFYKDGNGTEWPPDGGPCPVGTNNPQPECKREDRCTDHGPAVVCPLAGGGELTVLKVRGTRPQIGCASLNSRKSGKIIDTEGYSFILTVRMVSVGNTF